MELFLEDAERIFESAIAAATVDPNRSDIAILIDSERAIRIVDAAGWQLDSLQANYGATTVYRVAREESGVRLEGRSGERYCRLQTRNPATAARGLLNAQSARVTQLSCRRLAEPSRANTTQTAALKSLPERGENWNRLEESRDLFGILHGSSRPGT